MPTNTQKAALAALNLLALRTCDDSGCGCTASEAIATIRAALSDTEPSVILRSSVEHAAYLLHRGHVFEGVEAIDAALSAVSDTEEQRIEGWAWWDDEDERMNPYWDRYEPIERRGLRTLPATLIIHAPRDRKEEKKCTCPAPTVSHQEHEASCPLARAES